MADTFYGIELMVREKAGMVEAEAQRRRLLAEADVHPRIRPVRYFGGIMDRLMARRKKRSRPSTPICPAGLMLTDDRK